MLTRSDSEKARTSESHQYSGLGIIARGGILILVGSLISILANFIYQFLLARFLGPSEVGIINLGISVITLVSLTMIFGLDRTVVRYVALYIGQEDRQREVGIIRDVWTILGITALTITPVFWMISPTLATFVFKKPELLGVLRILCLGLPFIALTRVLLGITQAYKQMAPILLIEQVAVPVLRLSALIFLISLIGKASSTAALSFTLAAVIGCLPAVYFARRIYYRRQGEISPRRRVEELLQYAFLTMLTSILNRTNTQTETLVLGIFSSSDQVGVYTVGLKATVFISIFLDALAMVFAPFIAELYATKELAKLARQLKAVNRWALTLALPAAIALFIGSSDLMLLLGPGFEVGAPVLRLLVAAQIAYVLLGPGGLMLMMTDYNHLNLANALLNLILSLSLDILLIPKYGAIGAAIAGAITIVFVNLVGLYQTHHFLQMHPYNLSYLKPILAGAGTTLVALAINAWLAPIFYLWRLFSLGGAILLVYIGLILVLRLDEEDRELFHVFLRRLR